MYTVAQRQSPWWLTLCFFALFSLFSPHAFAGGIQTESLLPRTYLGADFSWIGAERADAYELLVRGGYGTGIVGSELLVPLGWYRADGMDTDFAVGNIGISGRAGTGLDLGAIGLELAGALTAYIPTAAEGINGAFLGIEHLRPGLREADAVPLELAVSAAAFVASVEITGTFGTTLVFPTDGERRTYTWLHGGLGIGVFVIPLLEIAAEYTVATRTGSTTATSHQVSGGVRVDAQVIELGLNVRIPVGGDLQLLDAPLALGVDFRFSL